MALRTARKSQTRGRAVRAGFAHSPWLTLHPSSRLWTANAPPPRQRWWTPIRNRVHSGSIARARQLFVPIGCRLPISFGEKIAKGGTQHRPHHQYCNQQDRSIVGVHDHLHLRWGRAGRQISTTTITNNRYLSRILMSRVMREPSPRDVPTLCAEELCFFRNAPTSMIVPPVPIAARNARCCLVFCDKAADPYPVTTHRFKPYATLNRKPQTEHRTTHAQAGAHGFPRSTSAQRHFADGVQ